MCASGIQVPLFTTRSTQYSNSVAACTRLLLKGQCREMDIFKGPNQHFLCLRWRFSRSFKSFSLPYTSINFFVASLKLILKMFTETLLRIIFFVVCQCSIVPASRWLPGKCARINLSQAASGMIFQNHRRLPVSIFSVKIAALGTLKWVTGRIFKISKFCNFKAAS
jgi:hypothetical protein